MHEPDRLPLAGVPDGLTARPLRRADGTVRRDRRRRVKATQVTLTAESDPPPHTDPGTPPPGITVGEWRWVLGATRRGWPTVTAKFGDRAWPLAITLTRTGTVVLDCAAANLRLSEPLRWRLTERGLTARAARDTARTTQVTGWEDRAAAAAVLVADLDDGLAAALTTARGYEPLLPVLVHAAEDLAAGISHDGPRAFSQAHFEHTKTRDDAPDILAAAGASHQTIAALGLRRSPYLGLGGPIRLDIAGQTWRLRGAHGPLQIRADQPMAPHLDGDDRPVVALIENLQAAETVCDRHPEIAVLWSAGQPSTRTLAIVAALAAQAEQVVIVTDADLGGVRIAARLFAALPDPARAVILDVGLRQHEERKPFGEVSTTGFASYTGRADPVGAFARAVAERGYPVEQEAAIRSALFAHLDSAASPPPDE